MRVRKSQSYTDEFKAETIAAEWAEQRKNGVEGWSIGQRELEAYAASTAFRVITPEGTKVRVPRYDEPVFGNTPSKSRRAWTVAFVVAACNSLSNAGVGAQDAARTEAALRALRPEPAARAFVLDTAANGAADDTPRALRESTLSERIPGLVQAANATPKQESERLAEEAIWRTIRPWQRTRRMRDARYWYIGGSFDALIFDDGHVEVRDKAGPTLAMGTVMAPSKSAVGGALPNAREATDDDGARRSIGNPKFGRSTHDEGAAGSLGVSIPYAGRTAERLATGKAPADAELRDFLDRTSELREFLVAEQLQRHRARELRRLEIKLYQLWNSLGPLASKQEATFAAWDEAADDEVGTVARAQVEAFVRELERERGACPFSQAELERLNAGRKSARPFAPCATPVR